MLAQDRLATARPFAAFAWPGHLPLKRMAAGILLWSASPRARSRRTGGLSCGPGAQGLGPPAPLPWCYQGSPCLRQSAPKNATCSGGSRDSCCTYCGEAVAGFGADGLTETEREQHSICGERAIGTVAGKGADMDILDRECTVRRPSQGMHSQEARSHKRQRRSLLLSVTGPSHHSTELAQPARTAGSASDVCGIFVRCSGG